MRNGKKMKILAWFLACACATGAFAGCGDGTRAARFEDVALLEPAGVALNYETAALRNLYDAKVYSAWVCPYVEEYSLSSPAQFDSYAALPGMKVKKGSVLIRTDTKKFDEQIKDMEKSIADAEEEYQEYMKDAGEDMAKLNSDREYWEGVMERWGQQEPEQGSERYAQWEADNRKYDRFFRNALIAAQKKEEEIKQRRELHKLDSDHNRTLLQRLKDDKRDCTLLSGMSGTVTSLRLMNKNDNIQADESLVAVADLDRRQLQCEYLSMTTINKAERIYGIIDGKRYELEYKPMTVEEYNRLVERNGSAYTTFFLPEDAGEIEMGSYAAVVLVNQSRESVVTVPLDAVTWADGAASAYVLRDGESVNVPVQTGMQDGAYVEIISGIDAGEKVLTDRAAVAAEHFAELTKGTVSGKFTAQGYLAYPSQEWLSNPVEYGTAYFEEYTVSRYQQVQKGDVLARIRVTADKVSLERSEKRLQRERERLADLNAEKSAANEKAIAAKQEVISDLEKLVAEMKEDFAVTEIKAPYDGIVTNLAWNMEEGQLLWSGQGLVMLAKQDSNYIVVEDENGVLTYGNQAAIEYQGENGPVQVTGMVVNLNKASLGARLTEDMVALIQIGAADMGGMAGSAEGYEGWWNRSRFKVEVTIRSMENVVLVPKKAVTMVNGTTYVKVVRDDGEICSQSFVAGGSDVSNYWVAEGLAEGMKICIE